MAHTTIDHGPSHHHPLLDRLAENWWLVLLRGIVAIAFGVLALLQPASAILGLALLYAIYAFSDGVLSFAAAFSRRNTDSPTWWLLLMGTLSILAGIAVFAWPQITAIVLVFVIATWAILAGIVEIVGAIELRKEIDNEWLLIAGGVVSVLFGVFLMTNPGGGLLAVVWAIGVYALIMGASWIALAFRLRRYSKHA